MSLRAGFRVTCSTLSLAVIAASVFFSARFGWAASSTSSGMANIVYYEGEVFSRKPGEKEWQRAKPGEAYPAGTRLRTGSDTNCDISIGSRMDIAVRLHPDSVLTLTSQSPTKLDLEQGKIFASVGRLPKGSTFEVETPMATSTMKEAGFMLSPEFIEVYKNEAICKTKEGVEVAVPEGVGYYFGSEGNIQRQYHVAPTRDFQDFEGQMTDRRFEQPADESKNVSNHASEDEDPRLPESAMEEEEEPPAVQAPIA